MTGDYFRFVSALVLVSVVGLLVLGGVAATVDKEEIQHSMEISRAYCYQVYDDPTVYNAMASGGHGGFHCEANADVNGGEGQTHIHQVPREYLERAYEANQSGQAVTFDHDQIAEPCSFWGMWCHDTTALIIPLGLVLAIVGGVGVFRYVADVRREGDD